MKTQVNFDSLGGGESSTASVLIMSYENGYYSFSFTSPSEKKGQRTYGTTPITFDTDIMTIVMSSTVHNATITYKKTCKYVDFNGNVHTKTAGTVDTTTELYAYCICNQIANTITYSVFQSDG